MSYRPDEKDWVAYLYGEMEEDERRKFDQYILQNPQAQTELERLRNLRGMLSSIEDKEVIAPPIVVGNDVSQSNVGRQSFWQTPYFRAVASVAASLLLIILVGRLSGMQVLISDNELRLSFGGRDTTPQTEQPIASGLTEDQVRQMIDASLKENSTQMQANLEESQRKLDASIRQSLAVNSGTINQLVLQASTASQDQIRQFAETIRAENMQQVKDYFQLTSTEQKQYIENLLVDFAKYLQQQRNDDLQLVQTRINSLEQNNVLLRKETEQILSSIITTVGTPVTGETKN